MPDTPDQTPAPDGATPAPAGSADPSAEAAQQLFQEVADATLPVSPPVSRPTPSQPRNVVPDLPLPEELTTLLPHGMYKVEGFLGQGGMGAVYKGTHVRLKRPVAIKIMHREAGRDYDFAQRFEREAQAMAKLSHPNIVGVHDYGEAGSDYLYIVMELVDGADMMDVIRTGRMTQEMALTLLPQICDALQFAHDHGIVHRDIKPSNIMLTRDGRVKMCDFGLAKRYDVESSFRTQTGTGMGTPDYAAPEQFKDGAPIDHRADIYALGVMIYQMITGELPRGVWKPPSQRAPVVPEWDDIVAHAMQSDPADRYQKASEVKTDVSRITPCRASVSDAKAAKPSHRDGLQPSSPPGGEGEKRRAAKPAPSPLPGERPGEGSARRAQKSRGPLLFGVIGTVVILATGAFFALRDDKVVPPTRDAGLPEAQSATGIPQGGTPPSTPVGQAPRLPAGGMQPPAGGAPAPQAGTAPAAISNPPSQISNPTAPAAATKDAPFINTLGMKFVPVPGTKALFSIWHTRVQDYAAYAAAKPGVYGSWKTQQKDGVPVGREPDHPVVGVSWEDAQAFCAWLTEKETAAGDCVKTASTGFQRWER